MSAPSSSIAPTDAELRQRILERRRLRAARPVGATAPRDRPLPLSPAQERLWLLDQLRPGGTEYLIPVAYRLSENLDPAALGRALSAVVARHEILRTRYVQVDDEPRRLSTRAGRYASPNTARSESTASRRFSPRATNARSTWLVAQSAHPGGPRSARRRRVPSPTLRAPHRLRRPVG